MHEQVKTDFIKVLEVILGFSSLEFGEGGLVVRETGDTGPAVVGGGTMEVEDFEDLINFRITHEEGLLLDHFSEDATDGPDVNTERVLLLAQENFRGSIPESFDFVGQSLDGDTKSSGKTEISELDGTILVDQKILGLQVSVNDSSRVAVVDTLEDLIQIRLNRIKIGVLS